MREERAEETLAPRNIQHGVNVNRLELDRVLMTNVRQSLYFIYREAVTNAAKHTSGYTVNINLTDGAGGFTVSIHDNGKVADKDYKTTGASLNNTRMRAASIGVMLSISTEDGVVLIAVWRKLL
jgi:signal transduction histidine kinase